MIAYAHTIRRSLIISFAGRYCTTLLQFVSVMILARLLTPEDIGIYTIGLVLIGIAHMIRDFGVGKYIVQEKDLTREKVGAALALTICMAWSMGLVIFFLAPYISEYFEEPAVKEVTRVVVLNFFIIPIGSMAPALFRRSMSFGTLFKINVTSTVTNLVVGISLAYAGFGYMSMAWASVASTTTIALMSQIYLPKKYRTLPKLTGVKKILGFGTHVVGSNLLQELDSSVLNTLVGKHLGLSTLGFLSRGQGYEKIYFSTIQQGANPVIHAHLAKQYRSNRELESSFLYVLNYVTIIGWFCLGFLGLMSASMIRLLYGDQWDAAIPIASILCLFGCLRVTVGLGRRLFDSTGRVRVNFRLSLTVFLCNATVIINLVNSGLQVLLFGLLLVAAVNVLLTYAAIFVTFKIRAWPLIKTCMTNILIVLAALVVPFYFSLDPPLTTIEMMLDILIAAGASVATWLILVVITKHSIGIEIRKFGGLVSKQIKTAQTTKK